jgi:hypothetical protein
MTLDYSKPGKVNILMINYVKGMLSNLPDEMNGEGARPAANHLFQVNLDAKKLDKETAQFFHHNVAKLLFLCKRARPDVQTAVAFLTTRVKEPNIDGYKKLGRIMQYLCSTVDLPLALEADNTHIVKWWVDALYAVHPNMKQESHWWHAVSRQGCRLRDFHAAEEAEH